jgi:hypothetical protein
MKSRGDALGLAAAAQKKAFFRAVVLFGVPRWRPPRRSPGSILLAFATLLLCYFANAAARTVSLRESLDGRISIAHWVGHLLFKEAMGSQFIIVARVGLQDAT